MTDITVIIVSYNVRCYLRQCLLSVCAASKGLQVQVIVADNDSGDGTVSTLGPIFPQVTFISTGGNLGFAKANNLALTKATGRYVLFLNPDTIISEESLRACLEFMDNNPRAGAAGVRMLNADGSFAPESRRSIPTPFVSFCKMSGLCSLFPKSRLFGRYYLGYLDRDKVCQIEVVSGAYMFVRRQALEPIRGFDEDYFMYGEDIDLSYRLIQAGWTNWYVPVPILHYKGESTNKTSFRYAKVFYNAMLIFFRKHYDRYSYLFKALVSIGVWFKTVFTFLANNLVYRWMKGTERKLSFMFHGSARSYESLKKGLTSCGIDVEYADASAPSSAVKNAQAAAVPVYTHLVYDASETTFSQMLNGLQQSASGYKDAAQPPKLGVYHPDFDTVITEKEIITL